MRLIGEGEMPAFGQLVQRHHSLILNFAYRLSGDEEMARDIAQDCLLRVYRAAAGYKPQGRFRCYLFAIVRNLFRELIRKQKRRRETPLYPTNSASNEVSRADSRSNDVPTPAMELASKRLRDHLQKALSTLSPEHRTAFVLSEIEHLSYRDIAMICQCPEGTIASRKHQAIVQLRQFLTSEGI